MTAPAPIILAGGTGDLGGRIARCLRARGAAVKALVRPGSDAAAVAALRAGGVSVVEVDFEQVGQLEAACEGGECVVSALSGLRDVIVQAQSALLEGAVAGGCNRFIPSDFASDFTRLPEGSNRNFDLRREFMARLNATPIAATSILTGMFTDLLLGDAPYVLPGIRRVLSWNDANPKLDFTTRADVAAYTAAAALDPTTPRILRISGDQVTASDLATIASNLSGRRFRLLHPGGLWLLETMIRVTRAFDRHEKEAFSAWQGMQYMRDMYGGQARVEPIDNGRYPELHWTSVRDVLSGDPRLRPRG